jgi:ribonuclease HI
MTKFWIFTDGGAFDKGGYKFRAVSSFQFFNENKELIHKNIKITEDGTSPFAEINAIANALENASSYIETAKLKNVQVDLYTDSMLCYNSLTLWIFSWMKKAKNGIFISSSGQPVLNQEEIKRAFKAMTKIRKVGKVNLYHINSHKSKKDLKKLKTKFEKFNKIKVSDEDFLFIYLQNAKCDKMIEEAHAEFLENQKPKNNLLERLKEGI